MSQEQIRNELFEHATFDELFVIEYTDVVEGLSPLNRESKSFDYGREFFSTTLMVIELLGALFILRARLLWSFPLLHVPELPLIVPAREAVPLLSHGDPACPHISRPPPVR